MDPSPRRPSLRLALTLLAGVYLVGYGLSLLPGAHESTWWTGIGVSMTFLVLVRPRHWPVMTAVMTVALIVMLAVRGPVPPLPALLVLVAQPVVAAAVLSLGRHGRTITLASQRDFVHHLCAAAVSGGLAATYQLLLGAGGGDDRAWLAAFEMATASTLVASTIAAASLADHSLGLLRLPRSPGLALQTALLLAVTVTVFGPSSNASVAFIPLPLLIWGASRYGVGTACWQSAAVSVACSYATVQGWGPFGAADTLDQTGATIISHTWNLAATCVALPIALAVRQQRAATEQLRSDQELFRRTFSEALVGMALLHREGDRLVIDDVNQAAGEMLRGHRGDLVGRDVLEVLRPGPLGLAGLADLLGGRSEAWTSSCTAIGRAGSSLTVAVASLPSVEGDRYAAQLLDVTLEREALRAQEESQQLTDATVNTVACMVVVVDVQGTVVRVNQAVTRLSGFDEGEFLHRPVWLTPVSPYTSADVAALFCWPSRAEADVREASTRRKDGSLLRMTWNSNIVRDEAGEPAYAVMTGVDVTSERSITSLMSHVLQASAATVLVGIDHDGLVTVFNSGAERLLGRPSSSVIGLPFVSLIDPVEVQRRARTIGVNRAFASLVGQLGPDGESDPEDWTWIARDGERLIVSTSLSVTRDDLAEPLGYLCVGRDVTAERRSSAELSTALERERIVVEQLRALDRAKDEFVSTVSHELRTPVTSIVGYTEMLRDGSVVAPEPAQEPVLEVIARNGARLIDICGDLLTLGGLDAVASARNEDESLDRGALGWEEEPVDLGDCVITTTENLGGLLGARTLRVQPDPEGTPLVVVGDRVRLEQALTNLLGNAVKFTDDDGTVTVRLRAEAGDAVVEVADDGIGIAVADQEAVFTRFYRTKRAQQLAVQGTGLGLPIVRALVEGHGGRVSLTSRPGHGTTVTLRLPLLDRSAAGVVSLLDDRHRVLPVHSAQHRA